MSAIAGIVSSQEPLQLQQIANGMADRMLRHARQGSTRLDAPGAALTRVWLEDDEQAATQSGQISLVFAGEIVEVDRLRTLLPPLKGAQNEKLSLGEILLQLYVEHGASALLGLNGLYSIAIWEATSRRLTLITDRYGAAKLYYWLDGKRFLFASEQKAISGEVSFNRSIDPFSLAEYCAIGRNLDDRTFFKDIKLLPHASIAVFQDGRFQIDQYWHCTFFPASGKIRPEREMLEEMDHLFQQSIRRRIRPEMALLLTGGLDSRSLAATLERVGASVVTTTAGRESCSDVIHGRDIARRLGFQHTIVPIPPNYLQTLACDYLWRTESNQNVHGSWVLVEDTFLRENNVRWVMTGLNGDGVAGKKWKPALASSSSLLTIFDSYYTGYDPYRVEQLSWLMRPEHFVPIGKEVLSPLLQNLQEARGDHVLNRLDYVWFNQIVRRTPRGEECFGSLVRSLEPFYDNDLFDFAVGLPPVYRMNGALYKKWILQRLPKASSAMYGPDDRPLWWTFAMEQHRYLKILAETERRIRRKLKPARPNHHGDPVRASVLHNQWLREESFAFVHQALNKQSDFLNFFNPHAVNALLDEHLQGKRNIFNPITALLTMALWFQMFCDG